MGNDRGRFQRHFRQFHCKETTGHPSYVYDETKMEYKTITLTSHSTTNGKENIPLDKNPNPKQPKEKSYLHPDSTKIKKGTRNEKLKGWKFAESDKGKVKAVIENGKKK